MLEQLGLSGYSRIEFVIAEQSADTHTDGISRSPGDPELSIFSLSGFTMSVDLTTVILTEQLYRAYTILNHITYHK